MLSLGGKAFLSKTPKAEAMRTTVRFVHKEIKSFCKSINTVTKNKTLKRRNYM